MPSISSIPQGSLDLDAITALLAVAASPTSTVTSGAVGVSTHQDQFLSMITLAPTSGTITAANGLNAIRGEIDAAAGTNIGGGATTFITGVYGRGNIHGTVDIGSGDLAAVYGKFDLASATLTSGHIAPIQANIVNPPSGAGTTVDLLYCESASGTKIKAGAEFIMSANYLFDLTEVGSAGTWISAAAGSSASLYLRVKANGTAYKIALLADS